MIAGVAIDDWKLPIFKKILDENGYQYTQHDNTPVKGCTFLKVETENFEAITKLKLIIKQANKTAAKKKMH